MMGRSLFKIFKLFLMQQKKYHNNNEKTKFDFDKLKLIFKVTTSMKISHNPFQITFS